MINYFEVFKNAPRTVTPDGTQFYVPNALCLFFANESLMPIAIQLVANNPKTVFTPKDVKYDWLLAKMYFKTMDMNVHTVGIKISNHILIFKCTFKITVETSYSTHALRQ